MNERAMAERLPPHFVELVYDALLKSFWRKKVLKRFLRRFGVRESVLAQLSESESKREWLDLIFPRLEETENGRLAIKKMAHALGEQASFPDLEQWEDSAEKVAAARQAIGRLKAYLARKKGEAKREQEARRGREESEARRHRVLRSKADLAKLRARLEALASRIGTQKAGYEFQDWFYDLMDFAGVEHRRPYVSGDRQIDGSVTIDGTTYLVELKFTAEQASAPDVDTFYKKVVTKSDNTMGIMVSMAGYSSTAKKEASGDKSPLLLLDHRHLYVVLLETMEFVEVARRVRRHSSQTGEAYLPPERFGSG